MLLLIHERGHMENHLYVIPLFIIHFGGQISAKDAHLAAIFLPCLVHDDAVSNGIEKLVELRVSGRSVLPDALNVLLSRLGVQHSNLPSIKNEIKNPKIHHSDVLL